MRPALPLLLALAACAAAPEPARQYLLEAPPESGAPAAVGGAAAIGLRELALPLYARRPQMAAEDPGGAVIASDDHRWAEEPARAATRLVARRLAARRAGPVHADPWPQGAAPSILVTTEVDRLLGALGGQVRLEGQATFACAAARSRAETRGFSIRAEAEGPDHAALAAAYGAALTALADEIGAALERFGACPG